MAEEGICPIESNIKHTIDGGAMLNNIDNPSNINNNEFPMDDDAEFADPNDAEFDDEYGDAIMNGDDEWDSIHSSNDGQDYIPVEIPNINNNKPVIGANDENPYGEGNEVAIEFGGKPPAMAGLGVGDPKQKCWICDICNGINNLLESLQKYNYKCCICSYAYHPNVAIIYSNDWDGVNEENNEKIYTVWNCPFCTLKNDINWNKCDGCDNHKPPPNQVEISYSYIKPKRLNGGNNNNNVQINKNNNNIMQQNKNNDNNNNNNKYKKRNVVAKQRKPRIENIGVAKTISQYPSPSVLNGKCEKRLSDIFGLPFKNKLLLPNNKNIFGIHNNICHARIEWTSYSNDAKKFVKEAIVGRGFAINNTNGWIASMSSKYIWVFEPIGGLSFKLIARYEFKSEQQLISEDISNSRIRFLNNNIFVWSFSRSRVYSFKLSYNSIILVDVIRDKYFKDSQTMDVAITNNLLILLFDRWCGVYKLYPKFEWYHAVAFATKSVNCFSLEIVNFDHEIVTNNEPIQNNKNNKNKKRFNIFNKDKQEEKKENELELFERKTNKNYLFINCENQLIGIHPTNPTFDFLHIAKDTQHGKSKYCLSKKYGVFYLNNNGKELYQSPNLSYSTNKKLINLNNSNHLCDKFYPIEEFHESILRNGIEKFENLCFDEQYGISGRLLLFCQTKKKEYVIHEIFNYNELYYLCDELSKIDYYLMPGMNTNKKKFNLIIFIFEYLYGQDLIDTLLQSEKFNPALAKIKKQQENQFKNYKNEKNKNNNQNNNNINNVEQDMDIEYPKEGYM